MKMLYVFFVLFTSQFALASSFKIIKEQTENGMKTLLSEMRKTASESTKSKIHPFLTMEGQKVPSGASSVGHNQAKCKRENLILVIVFLGSKGRYFRETSREYKLSFSPQCQIGQKLVTINVA